MAKTEVVDNKLELIVKESGLETTKAQYILERFQDYFAIASEWETKAKTIKVTSASQTVDMQMARTGRLFLKEKRCAIETARKELKEQALREGKAIDGIANVLKALIVPIEEYLDRQERFVEIEKEKKLEQLRIEEEQKQVEALIAQQEAEAKERERMRKENEKLKKEAEIREKKIAQERKKQEEILAKERAEAERVRKEMGEKVRIDKEKQQEKLFKEKAKLEKEKAKLEAERKEKERLEKLLEDQIECPYCHKKFNLEEK